jgi:hypothetical protein
MYYRFFVFFTVLVSGCGSADAQKEQEQLDKLVASVHSVESELFAFKADQSEVNPRRVTGLSR